MDTLPEGYYGIIGENYQETDYQVGGEFLLPKARHTFRENHIEYNQNNVHKYSCTIHGSIGALSDLAAYTFTLTERKELLAQAIASGFNVEKGWYVNSAVDLVRRYWNQKNALDQVSTFQIGLCSAEFYNALGWGYTIVVGFRGNKAYIADKADGVLDGSDFGVSTYGHCVRITKCEDDKYLEFVVDNYVGQPINGYKVTKENFEALVKNKVFFSTGYVFVFKNDLEQMLNANTLSPWAVKGWELAKKKGLPSDTAQSQEEMTAASIEADLVKLGKLTKKLGKITRERFYVFLKASGLI